MGDRGKVRGLLIAAVVAVGPGSQGCSPGASHQTPPPPLRPTIVGVVDRVTLYGTGLRYMLTDGRTVDAPHEADVKLIGGTAEKGDLVLASTTAPKFVDVLLPIESGDPGCWEAWAAQGDSGIIWDMGDSILFPRGLELPKAAGFTSTVAARTVDGRLAWIFEIGGIDFCATVKGEIDWAKRGFDRGSDRP
jgi:hypothetical protein